MVMWVIVSPAEEGVEEMTDSRVFPALGDDLVLKVRTAIFTIGCCDF